MALPKMPALFAGVTLVAALLTGCGGQALSQREIVRAVFFEKQGAGYSVCLLLADQNAPAGESAFKTASAAAATPAQALEAAAESLPGHVYYGLLDAAALPSDTDWATACELGMLLYDRAQPAPELSVCLLDDGPHHWQQDAAGLYETIQSTEREYKVHCGLQQLFAQPESACVPTLPEGGTGYDLALLAKNAPPIRCRGIAAQLGAILCGQASRLDTTFAGGTAAVCAAADLTADGKDLQLYLYSVDLQALTTSAEETALRQAMEEELQTAFALLFQAPKAYEQFHFAFWQQCLAGPTTQLQPPKLTILWE